MTRRRRGCGLSGASRRCRWTVAQSFQIVFAAKKIHTDSPVPSPDVVESEPADRFRVVTLEALVRMKLAAFRDRDRTHLRDLIEVGLVDAEWLDRLPSELQPRMRTLLETPGG